MQVGLKWIQGGDDWQAETRASPKSGFYLNVTGVGVVDVPKQDSRNKPNKPMIKLVIFPLSFCLIQLMCTVLPAAVTSSAQDGSTCIPGFRSSSSVASPTEKVEKRDISFVLQSLYPNFMGITQFDRTKGG